MVMKFKTISNFHFIIKLIGSFTLVPFHLISTVFHVSFLYVICLINKKLLNWFKVILYKFWKKVRIKKIQTKWSSWRPYVGIINIYCISARQSIFNSQAPNMPELAHQGIFQLTRLSVNCCVKTVNDGSHITLL